MSRRHTARARKPLAPAERRFGRVAVCGLLCAVLSAGCNGLGQETATLRQENERLRREVGRLERESITNARLVTDLRTQIARLQQLGSRRLDLLYSAASLEIERLSGGYDADKLPGDDGIVVYLRPLDAVGDAIKAAGDIRIELLDLANPDGQHLIGEYIIPVHKAMEMWYGRFMTYHYTIHCPWRDGPPRHPQITIRATFVDYLTGKELTATRQVEVQLAPDKTAS